METGRNNSKVGIIGLGMSGICDGTNESEVLSTYADAVVQEAEKRVVELKSATLNVSNGIREKKESEEGIPEAENWENEERHGRNKLRVDMYESVDLSKWDTFAGYSNVKEAIIKSIVSPLSAIQNGVKMAPVCRPCTGLFLFGPSGTGKSTLCSAIAAKLGWSFISIRSSDIRDGLVGEAERKLTDLFQRALDMEPCVLFFDELDAFSPSKTISEGANAKSSSANSNMMSEFNIQCDKLFKLNRNILLTAASNLPKNVDDSIRRRFGKCLYVPLPTERDRFEVLRSILEEYLHFDCKPALQILAQKTERCNTLQHKSNNLKEAMSMIMIDFYEILGQTRFSNADLRQLSNDILLRPLQICEVSCYFQRFEGVSPYFGKGYVSGYTPCKPDELRAIRMTLSDIYSKKYNLVLPGICENDFWETLKHAKATLSEYDLYISKRECEKFAQGHCIVFEQHQDQDYPTTKRPRSFWFPDFLEFFSIRGQCDARAPLG